MKKSVLVSGNAGLLGSHLRARLLKQECEVLRVDNFFTSMRRNIEPLVCELAFQMMPHDVTSPLYVEVDEIYNLACPASPIPIQTTKARVFRAINMLALAKRLYARVLQACTSEVYGSGLQRRSFGYVYGPRRLTNQDVNAVVDLGNPEK